MARMHTVFLEFKAFEVDDSERAGRACCCPTRLVKEVRDVQREKSSLSALGRQLLD